MDKRYQVFVSSTYADLLEERRKVIQALMELDCIPAGMELFPAADEDQFEFIKRIIDDCDYYLLIIGGRYGTTTQTGISYTEQEYEYAQNSGLKVIALIHETPDDIPFGKSEQDPALRQRLEQFRERVATGRLIKFWKTSAELPGLVALSISKAIKQYPAVGWVRADRTASEDLLLEINDLRKQNDGLKTALDLAAVTAPTDIDDLAGLDDVIAIEGKCFTRNGTSMWHVNATWKEIFALIDPYLVKHPNDGIVKDVFEASLFKKSQTYGTSPTMDDQDFQTISIQLQALGLIKRNYQQNTKGGMGLFWSATPRGDALGTELRTVRSDKNA